MRGLRCGVYGAGFAAGQRALTWPMAARKQAVTNRKRTKTGQDARQEPANKAAADQPQVQKRQRLKQADQRPARRPMDRMKICCRQSETDRGRSRRNARASHQGRKADQREGEKPWETKSHRQAGTCLTKWETFIGKKESHWLTGNDRQGEAIGVLQVHRRAVEAGSGDGRKCRLQSGRMEQS